jgi:hypothetical protein
MLSMAANVLPKAYEVIHNVNEDKRQRVVHLQYE